MTAGGLRLGYDEFGAGDRVIVLMPPSAMPRMVHHPLAAELAARGHRVICLDQLGAEIDDAKPRYQHYRTPDMAGRVIAVLDELGIESAIIGGKTNSSGIALEAAMIAPDRISGVYCEAAWMEYSAWAGGSYWTGMWLVANFSGPLAKALGAVVRRLPVGDSHIRNLVVTALQQDMRRTAALHQGFFISRPGPTPEMRATMTTPVLVITQQIDPVHGRHDARLIADSLPNSRLLMTRSWLNWFSPEAGVVDEMDRFALECFSEKA
ncbi:alpha/beta hydrolase [Nocardia uniformis]|uniref:Alpha/beta hydrolase n=1 Tax=Nocardia uniformis TaxID=53432 RepID=A0A849C295_9NOCA|nr:alpha/beta hydrolase [Nocardia uniformis]NNH72764.1 alpha/beta hydrolase [Nocardia uniformis]